MILLGVEKLAASTRSLMYFPTNSVPSLAIRLTRQSWKDTLWWVSPIVRQKAFHNSRGNKRLDPLTIVTLQ